MKDPLIAVLRAEPPASVLALPDDVRAGLAEQIVAAKKHQGELVVEAEARALGGVPLPLRGIVKKALGR